MKSAPPRSESRRWSRRILLRYTLLQLPALALLIAVLWLLATWFDLPRLWLGLVAIIWMVKDIVLFPLVWRAYDPEPHPQGNTLVGRTGIVIRELTPEGVVDIHGELWRARAVDTDRLGEGARVRVTAMHGLLLEVASEPPSLQTATTHTVVPKEKTGHFTHLPPDS